MNLLSGSIGVILCLGGNVKAAFLLMLAAAVFDFFDGLAARALGAYSDIGKELDSLADMVSFGLLPSIMLHETMVLCGAAGWVTFLPLLLAVFSALRLAKFNIDERQHDSFIGLATPAAAIICGSLSYYVACGNAMVTEGSLVTEGLVTGGLVTEGLATGGHLMGLCASAWFLPAVAFILAMLLVSEIPMFAMKFGKGKQADKATVIIRFIFLGIVALSALLVLVLGLNWSLIPLISFVEYILLNVINALISKR